MYAKLSKSTFAQTTVEYLGHLISVTGVSMDPSKVAAIQAWPIPTDLKSLRGFLGLAGYYRRFICNFGTLSRPLTDLLKKDAFHWSPQATTAFQHLKDALTQAPVLRLPDFTLPFVIETDASALGMGAVLMQEGRPIAFLSKAFSLRGSRFMKKSCWLWSWLLKSGATTLLAIILLSKLITNP